METSLGKNSFGMGDRFAQQGRAQLEAVASAARRGIEVTPVWNKSNREHTIIHSEPMSVRQEAEAAVLALGWNQPYFVDADHINLGTVERFITAADFYTIDVADFIGKTIDSRDIDSFISDCGKYVGPIAVAGLVHPLVLDEVAVAKAARKFLGAMQEAGRIHRFIARHRGDDFVAEVSVDETDQPQTPLELLLILFMLAREGVPCRTIAPKFTGRFNKGVDYVGDLPQFEKEFEEDLCVIRLAVREFGLPATLKLSVHSGSDKFSLYPIINRQLKKHGAGVHIKTAGTTWLEEVIGLAEAGGEGLSIARDIYMQAHARIDELTEPYATVLDIDRGKLPRPALVQSWTPSQFCSALRHEPSCPEYNPHFRQLIHVAFKVAAGMGERYLTAVRTNEKIIGRNVTENLLHRHILPIFN